MQKPTKILVPEGIPSYYRKTFINTIEIIETIFVNISETSTNNSENCDVQKIPGNLLHFLDVITDILFFSEKPGDTDVVGVGDNSPILHRCLRRFREVFRQGFRGVKYCTPGRFSETADKAEIEAIKLLCTFYEECGMNLATDEKEAKLVKIITQERYWIETVNESRRRKDLEVIMSECLETFKDNVHSEFGYLYLSEDDNDYVYYEEQLIQKRAQEMITAAKENFRNQIPFEDDERILQNLCMEYEVEIRKGVSDDLLRRNCVQRQVIQDKMDVMVEHGVELYTEQMSEFLDKLVSLKRDCVMEHHERIKNEVMPMFVNGGDRTPNEIGTHEYQVLCWNRFNEKVYDSFKNLVSRALGTGKLKLSTCETNAVQEIGKILEPINDILKQHGLSNFAADLRLNLETNLNKIFTYARDENKVTFDYLLRETKPIRLLTNGGETEDSGTDTQDQESTAVASVSVQLEKVDTGTNTDFKKKMAILQPFRWIYRIWSNIKFYFCFGVVPAFNNCRRDRCCA